MTSEIEYQCNNCGHEGYNTRAVPDVPELVRYGNYIDNRMHVKPTGEYVRYDQAAAMLAAEQHKTKDAEELAFRMDRFAKKYLRHMKNAEQRAEVAEAELAQIKVQVPYGYIDGPHFSTEPIEGWVPLYAAPTDAEQFQKAMLEELDAKIDAEFKVVELKAEIERLKETLQEIANSYTAHGYRDAMDAFQQLRDIAKDALHGKY